MNTKILPSYAGLEIITTPGYPPKKVVFKTGCFDYLHYGHVKTLEHAKSIGDILVVGIGSDKTCEKVGRKCVFDENIRAEMVAALECVNYVVILKENVQPYSNLDHEDALAALRPHFFHIALDDKFLKEKVALAGDVDAKPVICPPATIINFNQEIEPHSSDFKKIPS